ncbi:winged helix-turn-helix domain-containing protein [Ancylobacter pratisalsi]|uniref:Winged helix-turn-helix domain-containing protein n=1 Tax=Ancylobacter pratisalsi TaxID=1745854 RepID=A0A6P1YQ68_9HYPH|nr:winged helix-turn-helix domain-containing protein [Ancylobacter pratisalsi]QIB35050.1 winged helix-turn-helix domain-containing protein [Ancylobacter pratisalsi]
MLQLSNADARRIFIARQGLSRPRGKLGKAELLALIHEIGFVQVDSIATVERAHHHILFARNPSYRHEHLAALLEKDGELFEHWTHDASIIPSAFFIYWKHRFARARDSLAERWRSWHENGFETYVDHVMERVKREGPLMARDFEAEKRPPGGWWNWHPEKTALEYHWRTGTFAIAGREGFQKVYDLTERVIPARHFEGEVSVDAFVDWACSSALERLGFATHGEIAAFWDLVSPDEARRWVAANASRLEPVSIALADGSRTRASHAFRGCAEAFAALPPPPARLRVLSPFDPLLRDRNRAERLFGFTYRIEVFVPAPKRVYGYYVFPILEGDRMVGRIDMKADRKAGVLDVRRLWLEPGVRASTGRLAALDAELGRLARFAGVERVAYLDGWRGA